MSIVKATQTFLKVHGPVITTTTAIIGVVGTATLASIATVKVVRQLDEDELTMPPMWFVKNYWREYVPTAIVLATTVASVVGTHNALAKRGASAMGLYTITDTAFKEYKAKVVERLGELPEKAMREEIVADKIKEDPVSDNVIFITGRGDTLCYDTLSGRYFESDMETIRKAVNDINFTALNDMYASQNDFYREIGLPPNGYGEEVGWRSDALMEVDFSTHLSDDGRPALALSYVNQPIHGYYKIN